MHLLFVCFGMLHVTLSMTWQAHCMISRFRCPVMYQQYTPHAGQPQNEPLYGASVHGLHCAPLCLLLMLPRNLGLTASTFAQLQAAGPAQARTPALKCLNMSPYASCDCGPAQLIHVAPLRPLLIPLYPDCCHAETIEPLQCSTVHGLLCSRPAGDARE